MWVKELEESDVWPLEVLVLARVRVPQMWAFTITWELHGPLTPTRRLMF